MAKFHPEKRAKHKQSVADAVGKKTGIADRSVALVEQFAKNLRDDPPTTREEADALFDDVIANRAELVDLVCG